MLEKTEMYIKELLQEDEKYQELEGQICDLLPKKIKDLEDENVKILLQLETKIIEKAYLKGYSDGMKEYDKIRENPEKHLRLDQINKIIDNIEKPAAANS